MGLRVNSYNASSLNVSSSEAVESMISQKLHSLLVTRWWESRKAVSKPLPGCHINSLLVASGCESAGILQQDPTDSKNPPLPLQPFTKSTDTGDN